MRVCTVCREPVPPGMPVCPRDGSPAEDPDDDGGDSLTGTMIGEYRVKGIVGEGGMGQVYEGLQPVIGKRVAIKLLRRELATNKVEAQRLLDEARSVNAIGHRGIIDIFSFGALPDGRQYFVMEYLSGVSLSQHIRTHGALPVEDTLKLMDEMLAALGAAHGAGVIHRDLKPSNIFLVSQTDGSSFVKLLDFGIAKQAAYARGETPQTRVSRVMGTPEFMAPEQARGQAVGPRTDLYALGAVVFEMLTGEHLFDADNPYEIVNMHLSKAPRAPSAVRSDVPPEVDSLVLSMLEKDSHDRPPNAETVRDQLKRLRKTLNFNATRLALSPLSMTHSGLEGVTDESSLPSSSGPGPSALATRVLDPNRASNPAMRRPPPPDSGPVSITLPEAIAPNERRAMIIGGLLLIGFVCVIVAGLWVLFRKPPGLEVVEAVVDQPSVTEDQRAAEEAAKVAKAAKVEAAKSEAAKLDATRAQEEKTEAEKTEAAQVEAAQVEAAQVEAAKVEAAKAKEARANAAKAKSEAAKAEAAKPDAAKTPKVDALTGRYRRVQAAWGKVRAIRTPEDRRIFDVMLSELGKQLDSGSRSDATETLNDFVAGALGGKEP